MTKITFIGAGSTVFMKNIVGDILQRLCNGRTVRTLLCYGQQQSIRQRRKWRSRHLQRRQWKAAQQCVLLLDVGIGQSRRQARGNPLWQSVRCWGKCHIAAPLHADWNDDTFAVDRKSVV